MRPQRTFRPAVLDPLEERLVPSAAAAQLHGLAGKAAASVLPRASASSHAVGANNGRLNLSNRTIGNSVFAATTPVPVTRITTTPPAINSGSTLVGSSARTLGLSGLASAPGGVAFTNSAAPIGATTGLASNGSRVGTTNPFTFSGGINTNQISAVNALTSGVGFNFGGIGLGLTGSGTTTTNPVLNNFAGTLL